MCDEVTIMSSRANPPGYGVRHAGKDTQSKLGKLWPPDETRASDEAIVSNDPAGQHNPLASQGPLDGSGR